MKRDKSLDLVRCVACIFIVLFHFYVNEKQIFPHIESSNADLGELGVSLFFILSGASLYLSTSRKKFNVGNYAYKRFKGIFPAFWTAYIIVFLFQFFENGFINPDIPPSRIWLSVVGMDGFVLYAIPNFYCVGEWFVGTIIIIYLYFPLVKLLIDKLPKVAWILLLIVGVVFIYVYPFEMPIARNPLARIIEITFGAYYCKYVVMNNNRNKFLRWGIFALCISVFAVLLFVRFESIYLHMYAVIIMGISLFYIIAQLGIVMRSMAVDKIVTTISINSYSIFLVHHAIGNYLADRYKDVELTNVEYFTCFIMYLVLIAVFVCLVNWGSKKIMMLIDMIPKKVEE